MDVKPETSAKEHADLLAPHRERCAGLQDPRRRCAGCSTRHRTAGRRGGARDTAAASGAPHAPRISFRRDAGAAAGHTTSSVAPHSSQNLTPGRFSGSTRGAPHPDILASGRETGTVRRWRCCACAVCAQPRRVGHKLPSGGGWGRLPEGWSYGEATSVAVDAADNVYVFNAARTRSSSSTGRDLPRSWARISPPHGSTIGRTTRSG